MDNNHNTRDDELKKIIKNEIALIIPFVEKERLKIFFKYLFFLFVGIVVIVFIEYMSFKLMMFCLNGKNSVGLGVLWFLTLTWMVIVLPYLSFLFISKFSKNCNKKAIGIIKNNFLPKILNFFGDIKWIQHDADIKSQSTFDKYEYFKFPEFMRNLKWVQEREEKIENLKKEPEVLTSEEIEENNLFDEHFDARYIDNEFEGNYKGIDFKISETRLFRKQYTFSRYGSRIQEQPFFNGVILKLEIPKFINNKIMIVSKGFLRGYSNSAVFASLLAIIAAFFTGNIGGNILWKLIIVLAAATIGYFLGRFDDIKAMMGDTWQYKTSKTSKRFTIMSQKSTESDEISYQEFLNQLQKLGKTFGAKGIKCSIQYYYIVIAFGTNKNLFETGNLYRSLSPSCIVDDFYNQIIAIYDFMDYIKNNEELN